MPKIPTSLRLLVLALLSSVALTSCFDKCKKDDPKPKNFCGTPTTATTTGGSN